MHMLGGFYYDRCTHLSSPGNKFYLLNKNIFAYHLLSFIFKYVTMVAFVFANKKFNFFQFFQFLPYCMHYLVILLVKSGNDVNFTSILKTLTCI